MRTQRLEQAGPRVVRFPEARDTAARVVLGTDWRYQQVTPAAAAALGRSVTSLIGRSIWEEYPILEDTPLGTVLRYVMETRSPYDARQPSPLDRATDIITTAAPVEGGGISIEFRIVAARTLAPATSRTGT